MKTNTLTSLIIICVFFIFPISCQKEIEKYAIYVYGEAELNQPCYSCQLADGSHFHFPIFSFQNNPDSVGMRDFNNCRLSFNKEKEYFISYHFILYTYTDTISFEWEDSGQYFIDEKYYYHFESNIGQSWESLGSYWRDSNSIVLYDIPNEKNWRLQLGWDFSGGIIEKVKIN